MKKVLLIVFISFLSVSCTSKVTSSDIPKINGYWEIEKVNFSDGKQKDYTINQTFDYFEVKDNKGFRKKVTPQLDGTFLVNDDFEKIEIKQIEGVYFIYYKTAFSKWKEQLRLLSDTELILVNEAKNEYHYKKAAPINLMENGKEAK
jgi:inner membrane protein involved in colicin E2 resistance